RAARGPMTARHRSFTLDVPRELPSPRERILPALAACAEAFLHPPIANLGYRGIERAGDRVRTWLRRTDDPRRDLPQAALLMEKGGTGGALFRTLYRDFLGECTEVIDSGRLRTAHRLYAEAAVLWTQVAALIAEAGETGDAACLERAGLVLRELSRVEREAMQALRQVAGSAVPAVRAGAVEQTAERLAHPDHGVVSGVRDPGVLPEAVRKRRLLGGQDPHSGRP
ncbi:MAG: DUF4872 domain-containing protein, partial [Streptomyces sp.]|nr:DUF4872 domain-containing protein [Streptomyces sp.]